MSFNNDKRFYICAFLIGLAAGLLFTLINASWGWREAPGLVHLGFLQSDQNFYTAVAREIFERGNGFAYVFPSSMNKDAPAIYFQWPMTLLAWMGAAMRWNWFTIWESWRIVWSGAFFLSVALVLRGFIAERRGTWPHFLFVILGGGAAAIMAVVRYPLFENLSYLDVFNRVEGVYQWWFLNIFRNVIYPLEACYHACLFFTIWAFLARRWRLYFFLFAVTLSSSAFAGINLCAIVLPFLFLEWWLTRKRASGNDETEIDFADHVELTRALAGSLILIALFLIYYKVFIPLAGGEEGRALIASHSIFPYDKITMKSYFMAYFFALTGIAFGMMHGDFRHYLIHTPRGRWLLCWAGATWLLINNHWIVQPHGIQPPHFTRGYMFFPLAVMGGLGVRIWVREFQQCGRLNLPKGLAWFALALVIVFLTADSIVFTARVGLTMPHPGKLTIQEETWDALNALDGVGTPGEYLNVFNADDTAIGVLIPTWTRHNSYQSDVIATPFFKERVADTTEWKRTAGEYPLLEKWDIDLIVMTKRSWNDTNMRQRLPENAVLIWENPLWCIIDVRDKF